MINHSFINILKEKKTKINYKMCNLDKRNRVIVSIHEKKTTYFRKI